MTEYTKKVIFGSAVVFVFTVFAAFFGYLTRLLVARNLSVENFGLVYSIMAFFGLFSILQHMGLNDALTKYVSEFRVRRELGKIKASIIFTLIFQLSTAFILALAMWLLAPWLAENYFRSSLAVNGIRIYAIAVFLSPIESLFLSTFLGYQKPVWYSAANFARAIFIFLATLILFGFSKTILSPIISYVLVYSLSLLVYLPYFLAKIFPGFFKTKTRAFKETAGKMTRFGAHVIITAVAGTVITYTDIAMITYFKTLNDVAIYNAATSTALLLWFFGTALATVLLPLSSEIWKRKHSHLMGEGINMIYKYGLIIIIPFTVLMFVFPELILRILFGTDYSAGSGVLQILSIAAIFFTIGQVNMSILSGMGKPRINAKVSAVAAVFNFASNLILIPLLGIAGAAISTGIAFAIIGIFGGIALDKNYGLRSGIPVHCDYPKKYFKHRANT